MAKDEKKTVTDLKRGKAADNHQVPVDGEDTSGHNSFEPSGETLNELFDLQDSTEDQIKALKEKQRLKTQPEREKIAELKTKLKAARDRLVSDNYPTMELETMMRRRRLQRQAEQVSDELQEAQKKRLAAMEAAWKSFRALPLGQAAEAAESTTH